MYTSTQQVDDRWDDYFARSDDTRERFASEIYDMRINDLIEQEHHEYMQRVHDAGCGCDCDSYESMWSRVYEYANSGAVDDLLQNN